MTEPEYETTGNAVISADEKYRYALIRRWNPNVTPNDTVTWVMLNPSTADATEDDATIRKITKYSKRWGYSSLVVVNLFALRSREPRALLTADDPIGPDNEKWVDGWMVASDVTVAAWGQGFPAKYKGYVAGQADRLRKAGAKVLVLTAKGHPAHPLYQKDELNPIAWPAANAR